MVTSTCATSLAHRPRCGLIVLGALLVLTRPGVPDPALTASAIPDVLIDFEPDPVSGQLPDGSVPIDELAISGQYCESHGVTFGIDADGDGYADHGLLPSLEATGPEDPDHAFLNDRLDLHDTAAKGYGLVLGDYFLEAEVRDGRNALLITYRHPVHEASGEVWDIDTSPTLGFEQWRVEALDSSRQEVDRDLSPRPKRLELDGRPWRFNLRAYPPSEIAAIRIRFVGNKPAGRLGLAFDNFSPCSASPLPLFIPIVVGHPCEPLRGYSDVALVLDMSTSMLRTAGTHESKLKATVKAARVLIDLLRLESPDRARHDRVAVVGFNREAWVVQALTADRSLLLSSLDGMARGVNEFTRLDLAIDRGTAALRANATMEGNGQHLVLVTDGLPNQVPYDPQDGTMETTVLEAARRAKVRGIMVHTIAIGPRNDVDPGLLARVATYPRLFHHAPDTVTLLEVFADLSEALGCPWDRFAFPGPWPEYPLESRNSARTGWLPGPLRHMMGRYGPK